MSIEVDALRAAVRAEVQRVDDQIEATANRAATKAIDGFLLRLGMDTDDPLAMQKDFAHLRKWRESVEQVVPVSIKTSVVVVITGLLGVLYALFPHSVK